MTTNQLIEEIRMNHKNADCLSQIATAVEAMKEEIQPSEDKTYFAMVQYRELDSLDKAFLRRAATDHLKRFGNGEEIGSSDISCVVLSWFNQLGDFKKVIHWLNTECE